MATRTTTCNCGQLSLTYEGPDPERISLCQCYECQRRTGSVFSVQARLPIEHVTIEGESTTWTFPESGKPPATFRSCDSGGATYHFCPKCGCAPFAEGTDKKGAPQAAVNVRCLEGVNPSALKIVPFDGRSL